MCCSNRNLKGGLYRHTNQNKRQKTVDSVRLNLHIRDNNNNKDNDNNNNYNNNNTCNNNSNNNTYNSNNNTSSNNNKKDNNNDNKNHFRITSDGQKVSIY